MSKPNGNYGIDAPNVVRNLFLFSLLSALISIFCFRLQNSLLFWIVFIYSLVLFATGCWMLYGIKIAKPKIVLKMIQNLKLQGNEKVLDLGCGRGLLLCQIAKYLPDGDVHGIDLWSNKDQSGNSPEQTLKNAELEGVNEKITLHTGDVRILPFPSNSFDVVVSSLCLHNITEKVDRKKAILEIMRVLKPGGKFSIADIQRTKEYADFLAPQVEQINCSKPDYSYCPPITIVGGKKR